jgi:hypothetical protein
MLKSRDHPEHDDDDDDGGGGLQLQHYEQDRSGAMEVALVERMLRSRRGELAIDYRPKGRDARNFFEAHRARARQYMGMGFVEIAAECIGDKVRGSVNEAERFKILQRAFESTSDFPDIFQNVLNKSLLARYELHMPTYRNLAIERPFNDFRPHPQVRAGEFPQLQPVTETGELQHGTSTDAGELVSVSPYGVVDLAADARER